MLLSVVDLGEEDALLAEGVAVGLRFRESGLHAVAARG